MPAIASALTFIGASKILSALSWNLTQSLGEPIAKVNAEAITPWHGFPVNKAFRANGTGCAPDCSWYQEDSDAEYFRFDNPRSKTWDGRDPTDRSRLLTRR